MAPIKALPVTPDRSQTRDGDQLPKKVQVQVFDSPIVQPTIILALHINVFMVRLVVPQVVNG